VAPSATVSHIQPMQVPRRSASSAWWAIVMVRPEVSSSAVFSVGIGQGPMVSKGPPCPRASRGAGHLAGPDGLEVRPQQLVVQAAQCRDDMARAQNRAPKKAAKNITSEKMNQLMLQRKEASMR
jgi:hypothetical protein